jgi:hypothetical protein
MMLVSTAVIMTSALPDKIVASLPFKMFQPAHPFVKEGFCYRFPDENHTLLFVEAYFFPRANLQFFPYFFRNCHLSLGRYLGNYHDSPQCNNLSASVPVCQWLHPSSGDSLFVDRNLAKN